MARDTDGIIQDKFAASGDVGLGDLVIDDGWPLAYSTPGGKDPQRLQFNQLYRFLFALAKEINQKGPFLEYDATIDYAIDANVLGSDGKVYSALAANGPATSVVDPVGNPATWFDVFSAIGISFDDSGVSFAAANVQAALESLDGLLAQKIVDEVLKPYTAVATGSNQFPITDAIPTNVDGDEYMASAPYTPDNANNIITVEVGLFLSRSAASGTMLAAIYQDSITDALTAVPQTPDNIANTSMFMGFQFEHVAGSTASRIYKVRAGTDVAGTTTFNGISGTRRFGGVAGSFIKITERTP